MAVYLDNAATQPRRKFATPDSNYLMSEPATISANRGLAMAEQLGQPATPQFDSKTDPPDNRPLPGSASQLRSLKLTQPEVDVLVLRPARTAWLQTLMIVLPSLAALFGTMAWITADLIGKGRGLGSVVCSLFDGLLLALALLGLRHLLLTGDPHSRFDRKTGLMTTRRREGFVRMRWVEEVRPLATIVGVQLLCSGHQSISYSNEPFGTVDFTAYQLNLVLNDSREPRLKLSDCSNQRWTRKAGKELADFLGVPLWDQMPAGR